MKIGALRVNLYLPEALNLKNKRQVIKSLKDRLRGNFNISVSELDHLDNCHYAVLGIVGVSNDKKYLNAQLCKVVDFIEHVPQLVVVDYELEL
ncbi:MAG: DUF503 domain-containing protein [Candidatus Omnitrophota bacterium]